jgi:mannose/fructose/N-acetylgalactosamine-specific phosphotransferase system component IIB
MSAAKKLSVVTPIGKAKWFSLTKTDKFGNYTCSIELEDSPETHKLISQIDSVAADDFKKKPYEKQADGSYVLKVKGKSKGTKKTGETYIVNPPVLYNALGKKIEGMELASLNVGNGSEVRAKIEVSSYVMLNQDTQELMKGISCKIKSAQIAKLVEFQSESEDTGFDALELSEEDSSEGSSANDGYDF